MSTKVATVLERLHQLEKMIERTALTESLDGDCSGYQTAWEAAVEEHTELDSIATALEEAATEARSNAAIAWAYAESAYEEWQNCLNS